MSTETIAILGVVLTAAGILIAGQWGLRRDMRTEFAAVRVELRSMNQRLHGLDERLRNLGQRVGRLEGATSRPCPPSRLPSS